MIRHALEAAVAAAMLAAAILTTERLLTFLMPLVAEIVP